MVYLMWLTVSFNIRVFFGISLCPNLNKQDKIHHGCFGINIAFRLVQQSPTSCSAADKTVIILGWLLGFASDRL